MAVEDRGKIAKAIGVTYVCVKKAINIGGDELVFTIDLVRCGTVVIEAKANVQAGIGNGHAAIGVIDLS